MVKRLGGPVLAALLCWPLAASAEGHRGVVSLNVCADQLVMMLLPRERILSVSYLAADPAASAMAGEAKGLPLNHGQAEEILPLRPDLVIAGRYSARPTVHILQKLGLTVLDLEPESRLEDFRRNLQLVARATGTMKKANAILSDFDARLERLRERAPRRTLVFADYGANGMTSGSGTLVADVAHLANMRTLGEVLGVSGMASVSLEQMIGHPPDILGIDALRPRAPALANQTFLHPAFRLVEERTISVSIPSTDWACGTPRTLDALQALIEAAT